MIAGTAGTWTTEGRSDVRIALWYLPLDRPAAARLDECHALLSPEETARAEQFTHRESRRQFIAGRALLRSMLAHYAGGDPCDFEFCYNRYGKPALQAPAGLPIEFSLSHARGLVACALSWRHAVGIDVERDGTIAAPLPVARRLFAAEEAAALAGLPPNERPAAFLRLWTLKEALLKARGVGLSGRLADVSFSPDGDGPPRISFTGPNPDSPADWRFAQGRLPPRYHVALAVHCGNSAADETRMETG
jgi:4'-phosphopantetheinyl transferase